MSGMTSTMVHEISNGICKFSPTSTKGKTVFLFQTILLSFTPIMLLIVQNRWKFCTFLIYIHSLIKIMPFSLFSFAFSDMIKWKNDILHKDSLVTEATALSKFIICLQLERAKVSLAVFLDAKSGKATDLSEEYAKTDRALNDIRWREFGQDKIFENKLRFQIRIDDFRSDV